MAINSFHTISYLRLAPIGVNGIYRRRSYTVYVCNSVMSVIGNVLVKYYKKVE
jgi:hypothetical protein